VVRENWNGNGQQAYHRDGNGRKLVSHGTPPNFLYATVFGLAWPAKGMGESNDFRQEHPDDRFIHPKSFLVNQIVRIADREVASPHIIRNLFRCARVFGLYISRTPDSQSVKARIGA
jgi:hypothetical protein